MHVVQSLLTLPNYALCLLFIYGLHTVRPWPSNALLVSIQCDINLSTNSYLCKVRLEKRTILIRIQIEPNLLRTIFF